MIRLAPHPEFGEVPGRPDLMIEFEVRTCVRDP